MAHWYADVDAQVRRLLEGLLADPDVARSPWGRQLEESLSQPDTPGRRLMWRPQLVRMPYPDGLDADRQNGHLLSWDPAATHVGRVHFGLAVADAGLSWTEAGSLFDALVAEWLQFPQEGALQHQPCHRGVRTPCHQRCTMARPREGLYQNSIICYYSQVTQNKQSTPAEKTGTKGAF